MIMAPRKEIIVHLKEEGERQTPGKKFETVSKTLLTHRTHTKYFLGF
jgi:hypothetical protein